MHDGQDLSLTEHLEEIRSRILRCLVVFSLAFLVAYGKVEILIRFLMAPLRSVQADIKLSALTITESFFTSMKLAAAGAFILASPLILFELWLFVRPGLVQPEKRMASWFFLPVAGLFLLGSAIGYLGFLPFILRLLLSSMGNELVANFSYAAYVDFTVMFLFACGLMFELPVIIVFLDVSGIFRVERTASYRRHGIVAAFIVGGIISPPDVISQFLIAVPLALLLEFGIQMAFFCRTFQTSRHSAD